MIERWTILFSRATNTKDSAVWNGAFVTSFLCFCAMLTYSVMMCIWYKSYVYKRWNFAVVKQLKRKPKLLHNCEDHFHFYTLLCFSVQIKHTQKYKKMSSPVASTNKHSTTRTYSSKPFIWTFRFGIFKSSSFSQIPVLVRPLPLTTIGFNVCKPAPTLFKIQN